MKLTKQEQTIVIGTLIPLFGQGNVNQHIDKQKSESAIPVFNAMEDNTTLKQRREMMKEYKTKQQKRKFYDSGEWKRIREQVKKRDNYECQECKRNGRVQTDTNEYSESAKRKKIQLVVHHKKELEHHPELALEMDNLETVCVDCHNKEHGRFFEKEPNKWENDEKW